MAGSVLTCQSRSWWSLRTTSSPTDSVTRRPPAGQRCRAPEHYAAIQTVIRELTRQHALVTFDHGLPVRIGERDYKPIAGGWLDAEKLPDLTKRRSPELPSAARIRESEHDNDHERE